MSVQENETSLGQIFSKARAARGLAIGDVASAIMVPRRYLDAIEGDRFEELPAGPYACGFVRSYARYLSLAESDIVAHYKALRGQAAPSAPAVPFATQSVEQRRPTRGMILGGLATAVAVYSVWFTAAPQSAALPGRPALPDRALIAASMAPSVPFVQAASRSGSLAEFQPAAGAPAAADAPLVRMIGVTPTPEPAAPSARAHDEALVVEVVEEAWIEITDGETLIYSGVKQPGAVLSVPAGASPVMTTGNAGGVQLRMGAWTSGPLGNSGRVRRNIPLDPGHWAQQANAPADRT